MREVLVEVALHIGVFRRSLSIVGMCLRLCVEVEVEIMIAAIGACHIGDVPDGIRTSCIEYRATCHRIGVTTHILGTCQAAVVAHPLVVRLVPIGRIQGIGLADRVEILTLTHPFIGDSAVWNCVCKTCSIDTNRRFQTHTDIFDRNLHVLSATSGNDRCIESRLRNGDLWINQLVGLSIRELVTPLIGIRLPVNLNLLLINRSFERSHSTRLRHTSY